MEHPPITILRPSREEQVQACNTTLRTTLWQGTLVFAAVCALIDGGWWLFTSFNLTYLGYGVAGCIIIAWLWRITISSAAQRWHPKDLLMARTVTAAAIAVVAFASVETAFPFVDNAAYGIHTTTLWA